MSEINMINLSILAGVITLLLLFKPFFTSFTDFRNYLLSLAAAFKKRFIDSKFIFSFNIDFDTSSVMEHFKLMFWFLFSGMAGFIVYFLLKAM